jgi:hypothetical protein
LLGNGFDIEILVYWVRFVLCVGVALLSEPLFYYLLIRKRISLKKCFKIFTPNFIMAVCIAAALLPLLWFKE